jgi:SHS2 domain-containing protein
VVTPPLASPARKPATCSYLVERTARSVKVEVWASSLPELFTQASLGLADALGVPRLPVEPTEHLFTLRARDSHALLLLWLTELIGRVADERRLFVEIAIEQLTERELRARARGAEVAEWRLEPRADLLPELTMERGQQGIDLVMTLPTH